MPEAFWELTKDLIESSLERFLPSRDDPPRLVHEAMRYATLGNAHRLRSLLFLSTGHSLGKEPHSLLYSAAAIELIHSYILILDDIVDQADIRRLMPCTYIKFGVGIAQYACFLLSDLALDLILTDANAANLDHVAMRKQIFRLRVDLVAAQELEHSMKNNSIPATQENLDKLYALKGGSWFGFITSLAGQLSGATQSTQQGLAEFGYHLGIAYQIRDDISDSRGDIASMGKRSGMDVLLKNYVTVDGLDAAETRKKAAAARAISVLSQIPGLSSLNILTALVYQITDTPTND